MKCNLNSRLSRPAGDLFIVTNANGPTSIDSFFQKLLNELSLRHNLHSVHTSQLAQLLALPTFGGCSMQPPVRATSPTYKIPALTPAAAAIGLVDTISAHSTSKNSSARNLVADNLAWRAICDTLTQNLDPSAYTDRTAIVLANEESGAAAAMYALGRLGIRAVYTIGFEARKGCISENVATKRIEDLDGLRRMREEEEPFVVVNALPAGRGKAAVAVLQLLAEAFSSAHDEVEQRTASVFLDLTATPAAIEGGHKTGEPCEVAGHLGWKVYDEMDVKCRFATATFQELCGHRVPVKFGRRYGGLGARY
jgi:3-dehydroquinate dehydratase-1